MANFMENLWSSVFTPGTTPTLLIATNATFAALQLLLLALLVATYSVHFAVLSFLCAGLWWSINWFAAELRVAQQAQQEEEEKLRRRKKEDVDWRATGEVGDSADDEGVDTETEEGKGGITESVESLGGRDDGEKIRIDGREAVNHAGQSSGLGVGGQRVGGASEVRHRIVDDLDRSGEISTDSEWEKVSSQGDV